MKYLLSITFFLSSLSSFAQFSETSFNNLYNYDNWINANQNSIISLSSTYFASPYSDPAYLNYFILLHYNDETLINEITKKLKKENYFGLGMENTLRIWPFLNFKLGNKNFGLGLTIRNVYHQRIFFTDDLFTLMYEGNVPFAGKTARIAPLDFYTNNYQDVALNMVSRSQDKLNVGLGLSYIKGSRFYEFKADRGTLFTAADGDSVSADLSIIYRSSDPGKDQLFAMSGSGSAFSGHIKYDFDKKSSLFFSLDDLGFISWNNKSVNFEFDTSVSYTGYDIFDQNNISTDQETFLDTFFNISESPSEKARLMWLNPTINILYAYKTGTKGSKILCGITYRFDRHVYPGAFIQYQYRPVSNLYLQGGISYDEFRKAGGNLELGTYLFKHLIFKLGTYHIEQFFTPFNGQSLYFDLTAVF